MKTVCVLMVEYSSGDWKDFSQHKSYSDAEWESEPDSLLRRSAAIRGSNGEKELHPATPQDFSPDD
jgi:hypothetical protein